MLVDRLRRLLNDRSSADGPSADEPSAHERSVDERWDDLLRLLFPAGLDERRRATAVAAGGDADPFSPTTVRRVLGALDQQDAPSPVTVRWSVADLDVVDVDGVGLALDRADASVSAQIRADGTYEPHVAAVLDRVVPVGGVVVDVGANVGYHTVRMSRRVGPSGTVVAVEANPENARLLAHTIASNGLGNVRLVPLAMGAGWGHVHLGVHIGSNGGVLPDGVDALTSGRGSVVAAVALDDLRLDRVDVVKLDVEGAEPMVIDGATATIERCRPYVVMELSCEMTRRVSGVEPLDHLARFVEWGYTAHLVERPTGRLRPIVSVERFLAEWGDLGRLEDLLMVPPGRPTPADAPS